MIDSTPVRADQEAAITRRWIEIIVSVAWPCRSYRKRSAPHPTSFSRDSPRCQCSSFSPRFSQASCGSGMVRNIS